MASTGKAYIGCKCISRTQCKSVVYHVCHSCGSSVGWSCMVHGLLRYGHDPISGFAGLV